MSRTKRSSKAHLAKFPDMEGKTEDSLLRDMACPECGHRDHFRIQFTGTAEVYDYTSSYDGDHEWGRKSHCRCPMCDHCDTVGRFTFRGLDERIANNNKGTKPNESEKI